MLKPGESRSMTSVRALADEISLDPNFHSRKWDAMTAEDPEQCDFLARRLLDLFNGQVVNPALISALALSAFVEADALRERLAFADEMRLSIGGVGEEIETEFMGQAE